MKKITKILLITVLTVALLAGCAGKKQKGASEQVNSENTVLTVTQTRKNIENMITATNYGVTEKEDGTVSYTFRSDLFHDYDLDYVVSLGSDTRINLPQNFSEMSGLGWKSTNESYNNLMLKSGASTNVVCGRDGKEVMVYLNNYGEKEIRCTNGIVSRVKFDLYSNEDGYKERLATAPDFKIGNSIDNNTDMNGIISAIGQPSNIIIGTNGDNCSDITVLYQNVSDRNCLKFVLSSDGKKIVNVDYNVG